MHGLMLLFMAVYLTTWWFAVWLVIGRREALVVPFFGVLILGVGVPIMLVGWRATSPDPSALAILQWCWMALPFVMVTVFTVIGVLRPRSV